MSWQEIIIHHAAAPDTDHVDAKDYDDWHRSRGWRAIGYTYVIERVKGNLQILGGRPLWMTGSHCPGHNSIAIGVCLAGDFTSSPPDPEMLAFAASHVGGLCVALNIPSGSIFPHRHFRETECPGAAFPWDEFIDLVDERILGREVS